MSSVPAKPNRNKYSYHSFDASKLVVKDPSDKEFVGENGDKGKYHECLLMANTGTAGDPVWERGWLIQYDCGDWVLKTETIDGQPTQCWQFVGGVWSNGIRTSKKTWRKAEGSGFVTEEYTTYQVKITFDQKNPHHQGLTQKLDQAHLSLAKGIQPYKQRMVGIQVMATDNKMARATGFESLVYRKLDQNGDPEKGFNSSQFASLTGKPEAQYHTVFLGLDGKEIDWNDLMNCDFLWIPLIKYTHLYCGNGKVRARRRVDSGLVLEMRPRTGAEKQIETLKQFQSASQLAKFQEQKAAVRDGNFNYVPEHEDGSSFGEAVAPMDKMNAMASGSSVVVNNQTPSPTVSEMPSVPQPSEPTSQNIASFQSRQPAQNSGPHQTESNVSVASQPSSSVTQTQPPQNASSSQSNPQTQTGISTVGQVNPSNISPPQSGIPTQSRTPPQTQVHLNLQPRQPSVPGIPTNQSITPNPTVPGAIPGVPGTGSPSVYLNQ